jgi:hypothetical protein
MTIYVIIKWDGIRWRVKGKAFVMQSKAMAYVKDDSTLKYTKVTLDVDCG